MPSRPHSVEQALNRVRLPEELDELIHQTVRRTRLRRDERIDLALELIDRVTNELIRDREPAEIVAAFTAEFGEPVVAAKLFRQRAIERRSRLDRVRLAALKWGSLAVAAVAFVVVTGYLGVAWWLWRTEPTIAFDPYERLVARFPEVAPDDAAMPLYVDALAWYDSGQWPDASIVVDLHAFSPQAEPEVRARAIAILRANRAEIDRLREAAAKPTLGETVVVSAGIGQAPNSVENAYFFTRIPHFVSLGRAHRTLVADAMLALDDGDDTRAVDNLIATLAVARHGRGRGTLVEQLVESARVSAIASQIVRAIDEAPARFGTEAFRRLQEALESIDPTTWTFDFESDRLVLEDFVQRVFSDDGHGDGRFLPRRIQPLGAVDPERAKGSGFLAAPLTSARTPRRRDVLDLIDRVGHAIESATRRPLIENAAEVETIVQEFGAEDLDLGIELGRHLVLLQLVIESRVRPRNLADAAIVAIALERWRRDHGDWPETLDELVPGYLSSVPLDIHDGRPLRYRVEPTGPRLWSAAQPPGTARGWITAPDGWVLIGEDASR